MVIPGVSAGPIVAVPTSNLVMGPRKRLALDRARHPEKYSRAGVPNGIRKAEAQASWDKASTLSDAAMKRWRMAAWLSEWSFLIPMTISQRRPLHEAFKLALASAMRTTD